MSDRAHASALVPLAGMQVVGVICGVIGVRWSSSVIPPDVLGIYGLLLSTAQLAVVVTHQGLIKHVQRNWTPAIQPRAYVMQLVHGSGRATLFLLTGTVVVLAGLHAIAGTPFNLVIVAWAALVNLLAVVALGAQSALQTEARMWGAFAISAVGSMTRSFVPPLLATLFGATLLWLNTGFLAHVLAQVAIAAWLLRPAWQRVGSVPSESAATLQRTVGAFVGVGLCAWLAAAAPRWLAALALTPEEVGYFVLAGNLSLVVPAVVGGIAFNHTFPALFAAGRAGADAPTLLRMTNRTVASMMIGSQVGLLGLLWIAPWLLGIVIHPRYADAIGWLLPTGGAALAATTTQFYHNVLLARQREADCLRLSVLSASLRLVIVSGACALSIAGFRAALIALPWVSVAFESWYAHRRVRSAATNA